MAAVLGNIASPSCRNGEDAPRLMTGTGNDQTHLLVVCTAERGLCGGFNSQIARLAREHITCFCKRGQDGQDPLRWQEGRDILRRQYGIR